MRSIRGSEQGIDRQSVRWRRTDVPSLEALRVERRQGGLVVESDLLVLLEDVPHEVSYRLLYDSAWRFRSAELRCADRSTRRELAVVREPVRDPVRASGAAWRVNGETRADLGQCSDLDLVVTPFTNTPPLWRFGLSSGEARSFQVAWIRVPELSVTPVRQEYVALGEDDPPTRFLYRNLESGFEGELQVDAQRLVVSYGPWRRL